MKKFDPIQKRTFTVDGKGADKNIRMVSAAISSEKPVEQFFGTEILVHEKDSVNMERAAHGLPLLWSHNREQPIGRVDNIRIDTDKVMRGDLYFSSNPRATEVWNDVVDGFLRDVSLSYQINDFTEEGEDTIRVTRFTPLETSIVTVPADSDVGINRNHNEGNAMSVEDNTPDAGTDTPATDQSSIDVKENVRLFRIDKEQERKKGAEMEASRREGIRSLFSRYEDKCGEYFTELREYCELNPLVTVDAAKEEILEAIAAGYVSVDVTTRQDPGSHFSGLPKITKQSNGSRVSIGDDQIDKFTRAAEVVIAVQANGVYTSDEQKEAQRHEFYSMSVSELAREYLRITGRRGSGQKTDIIGTALQRDISHSSSHFASVLENVANKSMLDGFMQAPETWGWAQTRNIPDFKAASLLNMSLFGDLDEIKEGAQYEYGDMSDIKETIQLATYGKLFGITRQALAGDDLNALGDIPRGMGAAAAYKIGDIVYAVLTTNAALVQDAVLLFDASTHGNYVTSGAAPSVATLNTARTSMALQTDPNSKVLGIRAAYLIVPIALQTTAETLIAATYDPAAVAGTLTPNPFQNTLAVVADHRLDTANAAGWYLAAARNTVVVGFLNGQQTPYLESKDGWSIDGVEYKVRIDAAAAAADYRGLYYNDGVT